MEGSVRVEGDAEVVGQAPRALQQKIKTFGV
jgi:hypothetical protein